jgi:hypothetical protein
MPCLVILFRLNLRKANSASFGNATGGKARISPGRSHASRVEWLPLNRSFPANQGQQGKKVPGGASPVAFYPAIAGPPALGARNADDPCKGITSSTNIDVRTNGARSTTIIRGLDPGIHAAVHKRKKPRGFPRGLDKI